MKKRKQVEREAFTPAEGPSEDREEFEGQLEIDADDLDEALIRQPELIYHVQEQVVLAQDAYDLVRLELKEAEADEDNKVRALAEKNEDKITEPFVKKQVEGSPRIVSLKRKELRCKKEVGLWEALRDGFKARGYALSGLVDLNINRSPSGAGSAASRRAESIRAEANAQRRKNWRKDL